jgi:hypothetical protein
MQAQTLQRQFSGTVSAGTDNLQVAAWQIRGALLHAQHIFTTQHGSTIPGWSLRNEIWQFMAQTHVTEQTDTSDVSDGCKDL